MNEWYNPEPGTDEYVRMIRFRWIFWTIILGGGFIALCLIADGTFYH